MMITQQHISAEAARELAQAVLHEAEEDALRVTVAVTDANGAPVYLYRMDHVAPNSPETALDKAYTSAITRVSTMVFGQRMDSASRLSMGLSTRARLITWGGGLPIRKDRVCIGGLGISGAKDHEDVAVGQAALKSCGFDPVE